MNYISFVLVCIMGAILSGCSVLGPVKTEQTSSYVLNHLPRHVPTKASRDGTIMVSQPETSPAYNTTSMAYTIRPYQVAYFAQNQWAETPAQMLQPLIVQTLQMTNHYHAVVTPPYMGKFSYLLSTQILQLQQDYIHQPNSVVLTVRAVLTRMSTNSVIATKDFTIRAPIAHRSPYSGVIAANIATSRFLAELAAFSLRYS